MTYREAIAKCNGAYARLHRAGKIRPIDEQIIISELRTDLLVSTPDPAGPIPPIPQPPLPPCLTGAPERIAA